MGQPYFVGVSELSKQSLYLMLENGSRLDFILDVGKRKSMSLTVKECVLYVRVPYGCPIEKIKEFILSNTSWIEENLTFGMKHIGLPKKYEDGEEIQLLGEKLVLSAVNSDRARAAEICDGKLCVYLPKNYEHELFVRRTDTFLNELAYKEITSSMKKMSILTGLAPDKLTIKPMTASWGRCISNRHISINAKVIKFDRHCIDYVCLHELCHLKYMNHGDEFWKLVEKFCPDRKEIREIMKY